MANSRVRRGRRTQDVVAEYLRPWFPWARSTPASVPGRDVQETPGLSVEVKARRGFNPKAALLQAERNAGGDIPLAVLRLDGQGEDAGSYVACLRLRDFMDIWGDERRVNATSATRGDS